MSNEKKCFVARDGWCSKLIETAHVDTGYLHTEKPLDLKENEYTTLSIRDEINKEFIRVHGPRQFIERESHDPRTYDCGATVQFEWTLEGIEAVWDKTGDAPLQPEMAQDNYTGEIKSGNYDIKVVNGLITKCERSRTRYLQPGIYHNASICVDEDGCVTELAEGNPLRSGKSCQSCGSDW